ncbi:MULTISPECIES: hypothetical protein [Streptomycetaceae]|uniref:Cell division initiation protein n=1 Tax=Streptantibioticus cattleyicolor (strain ATCC 35852 / DSM 46488 / JCM 4925 / NBRC 14057 / NRRL 8057) TaxID=1003195 RepID=F8JQM3_STREN|nr:MULTISPECIES: hypothetical protein [Streptomycetaceae]AEW96765.1 hypothetical protein SCATT_43940 [Streptantibioticus cattleyicolor NRRL 8057 = DSM 46488]MYS61251.1 cell division initiation protein [Streptomyces sp. SID5468]CCB77101.1 conserved protein of unknown function [Streptantibioticus cattleyicolor NRRL 8057 = DSM 46488]
MDVQKKLDEIVAAVEGARSMPMSASCVINRAELLAMVRDLQAALPEALSRAEAVIGDREQVVAEARAEADRVIAAAHEERAALISGTEVARHAQEEADRLLAEARAEADEVRAEADEYVDSKLANFEVVLTKTLGSVDRGREKLLGRDPGASPAEQADPEYDAAPERTSDPDELRRRADAYVDAKLGAFEAVLAKTLEAVGRGRQKLTGHRPIDDLAAHLAAQDALGAAPQSDDEYLAGLAAGLNQTPVAPAVPAPSQPGDYGYPQQPGYAPAAAGYEGTGYQDPSLGYGTTAEPQHPGYQGYYGTYQEQPGGYGDWPAHHGYQEAVGQAPAPQTHPQQPQGAHAHVPQQPAGLDETSFFDTSLIDLNQLRELDGGR